MQSEKAGLGLNAPSFMESEYPSHKEELKRKNEMKIKYLFLSIGILYNFHSSWRQVPLPASFLLGTPNIAR